MSSTSTAKDWWKQDQAKTPGPSRIRTTFNRKFTAAEAEHLRRVATLLSIVDPGEKMRVTENRIWSESHKFDSRTQYDKVSAMIADGFVNIYPLAVRTFRELAPAPALRKSVTDQLVDQLDLEDDLWVLAAE